MKENAYTEQDIFNFGTAIAQLVQRPTEEPGCNTTIHSTTKQLQSP